MPNAWPTTSFGRGLWRAALLTSTALLALHVAQPRAGAQGIVPAASSASVAFRIPPQPLSSAIVAFSRAAGVSVGFGGAVPSNLRTQGVSGTLPVRAALAQLLAGTGLTYRFTTASTVVLQRGAADGGAMNVQGAIMLDQVNVSGGRNAPQDQPYRTPGSGAYISSEQIERFPGTTPGDILKNAPGVLSGENRNGGAIDVNIRGMQGMGRVPVTIDGSINATTVYQGYQGVGNRTYIDPDLIGGISIEKGPSTTPGGGIGGLVSMRTLTADDILRPGQVVGARAKGSLGTNTTDVPMYLTRGGYNFPAGHNQPGVNTRPEGMDRPSFLTPTNRSGSLALAAKTETVELVGAVASRAAGNYYAGTNGPSAGTTGNVGPVKVCNAVSCSMRNPYYNNSGLTVYRAGEEVLNTSAKSSSLLFKGKAKFGDGQSLELGYIGFRSENGDQRASGLTDSTTAPGQQYPATADTDTFTARYHWKPAGSDLIDFKANAWTSALKVRQQTLETTFSLAKVGRPPLTVAPTYVGSDSRSSGGDVTNTARFDVPVGRAVLDFGASYLHEDTRPTDLTKMLESFKPRDGSRQEAGGFSKLSWSPVEWLTVDGSLRYQSFWSEDRGAPLVVAGFPRASQERSGGGFSPGAGITVEPIKGIQLFGKYAEGLRLPSLMETSGAFLLLVSPDLKPERAHTWEFGGNVLRDGVVMQGDQVRFKAAYFNNRVEDFLSRKYVSLGLGLGLLNISNIAQANFAGFEMQSEYRIGGFTVGVMGTYYTTVQFCRTTATCSDRTLAADYANNYVPPQYTGSVTVSQKLFDDALTIGGRASYVGPRPGGAEEAPIGAQSLITPIIWQPYTLVDLFASYQVNDYVKFDFNIENLTDRYYVDPLSLALIPSPGRTFRGSLTIKY